VCAVMQIGGRGQGGEKGGSSNPVGDTVLKDWEAVTEILQKKARERRRDPRRRGGDSPATEIKKGAHRREREIPGADQDRLKGNVERKKEKKNWGEEIGDPKKGTIAVSRLRI